MSPIYPGYYYVEQSSLYDTEPVGAEVTRLFRSPIGIKDHYGYVKDLSRTNMYMPSVLPNPQKFLIRRIYCLLRSPEGQLLPLTGLGSQSWDRAVLRLAIGLKVYVEGPAVSFAHPNIVIPVIHKKEKRYRFQQWRKRRGRPLMELIEQSQYFAVDAEFPNAIPGSSVTVELRGDWTKAIQ